MTAKIHAVTNAPVHPVRFILTAGQAIEYSQANALIEGFSVEYLLANKGCDSDVFILQLKSSGAEPVIPSKGNRIAPRDYDKEIDKERNRVERLFQKLKNYLRVVIRYKRLLFNDMRVIQIASIMI